MRKLALVFAIVICLSNAAVCRQLEVHAIDVGQGDCTLILSPDGKTTVLIDAGDEDRGTKSVLPYLRKHHIDHLSYVFASHYDADHIGGLDEVIKGVGVKKIGAVYDRGDKPSKSTTATFKRYSKAADGRRKTLKLGQVISLGGGVSVKCVAEDGTVLGKKPIPNAAGNENNLCVALLLTYKHFRYCTAGDSGGKKSGPYVDVETSLAGVIGHVNAMKVDHHGSASSSNEAFLKALRPTVALIDVGTSDYKHPRQPTLDRLVKAHCTIYQTEAGNGGHEPATCDIIAGGSIKLATDGQTKFSVACGSRPAKSYPIR
jgi:competence protein ComEC